MAENDPTNVVFDFGVTDHDLRPVHSNPRVLASERLVRNSTGFSTRMGSGTVVATNPILS